MRCRDLQRRTRGKFLINLNIDVENSSLLQCKDNIMYYMCLEGFLLEFIFSTVTVRLKLSASSNFYTVLDVSLTDAILDNGIDSNTFYRDLHSFTINLIYQNIVYRSTKSSAKIHIKLVGVTGWDNLGHGCKIFQKNQSLFTSRIIFVSRVTNMSFLLIFCQ